MELAHQTGDATGRVQLASPLSYTDGSRAWRTTQVENGGGGDGVGGGGGGGALPFCIGVPSNTTAAVPAFAGWAMVGAVGRAVRCAVACTVGCATAADLVVAVVHSEPADVDAAVSVYVFGVVAAFVGFGTSKLSGLLVVRCRKLTGRT